MPKKKKVKPEVCSYMDYVDFYILNQMNGFASKANIISIADHKEEGDNLQGWENRISALIQDLAWAQGYLMARGASGCGDAGHEEGVKEGEKQLKAIRKAIGFTQP